MAPLYPFARVADQSRIARHPAVVVGTGPVGLATALDLGWQGVPVLPPDAGEGVSDGSRVICFAKRTLEIADRLGARRTMLDKGVVRNVGRVFHDDRQIYDFYLSPEAGRQFPAFINLQQPYFEEYLFGAILAAKANSAPIEIRGKHRVTALETDPGFTTLVVDTPDGPYRKWRRAR